MYMSPEHAIFAAFNIAELPIEPKNATQMIIEMLRERFDIDYTERVRSGFTPHDWHTQAMYTLSIIDRTLKNKPVLAASILAEYWVPPATSKVQRALGQVKKLSERERSMMVAMAKAYQIISDYLAPRYPGLSPFVLDHLVKRAYRKTFSLHEIADMNGIPYRKIRENMRNIDHDINMIKNEAIDALADPFTAPSATGYRLVDVREYA